MLFLRLAAAGAGRPADKHGFADGPWTAETLADAISSIEANENGIEVRAVQVWFQDNYNGISDANIRWLARVFGCGDPEATSQWQAELRAAKDRLTKERRERRKNEASSNGRPTEPVVAELATAIQDDTSVKTTGRQRVDQQETTANVPSDLDGTKPERVSLAKRTEAMFNSESSLNLPLVVFTGACALALIAFTLNIHSVLHTPKGGQPRQVGFFWAPNWTVVFVALLPLFLAILIELLNCWREEWRPELVSHASPKHQIRSWDRGLDKASYSFWVTFFVTVIVASGYNWIATHLVPLLTGDPGGWPMDWGRIAIVKPDQIPIPSAIAFSGIAFVYNGFSAYLFFSGHVLMHLMKADFALIMKSTNADDPGLAVAAIGRVGFRLMTGIFRCTAIGIVITIMMKLQSAFLQSGATNIVEWLWSDVRQVIGDHPDLDEHARAPTAAPGFIYSFLCVLAIVGTFINAQLRIRLELSRVLPIKHIGLWNQWTPMNIGMTLLVTSYFAVGLIPGFTIVVLFSLLVTVYLVAKPAEREVVAIA